MNPNHLKSRSIFYHLPVVMFLIGVCLFLFRYPLLYGYRFIGNSDRWNHFISFLYYYTSPLNPNREGKWVENLFGGFDSHLLTFSGLLHPLLLLSKLGLHFDVVSALSWVSAFFLLSTLIIAYFVFYEVSKERFASLAGAFIYGMSEYSLLKLVQNDNTYLNLPSALILFWIVYKTSGKNIITQGLLLAFAIWLSFYTLFLQEFAYILIFTGWYVTYSAYKKNTAPFKAFALGVPLGIILSLPRLISLYSAIHGSGRGSVSFNFLEEVGIATLLRMFSANIYGYPVSETMSHTGRVLNFSEGNLLFSSTIATTLIFIILGSFLFKLVRDFSRNCYLLLKGQNCASQSLKNDFDFGFFKWHEWLQMGAIYLLLVLSVVHWKTAYWLFSKIFLDIQFLHARFCVSALIPMALLITLWLVRGRGDAKKDFRGNWVSVLILGCTLVLINLHFTVGWVMRVFAIPADAYWASISWLHPMSVFALVQMGLTFFYLGILWLLQHQLWIDKSVLKNILIVGIIGQSIISADSYINGRSGRFYETPFGGIKKYDHVMARPNHFLFPTQDQLKAVHQRTENLAYRSLVVCPDTRFVHECSNSTGLVWGLRIINGYLSSIPDRLSLLAFPFQYRSLDFYHLDPAKGVLDGDVPWKLASLLNVKYAIIMTPKFFTNEAQEGEKGLYLFQNPSKYIYPRVYFSKNPVSSTKETAVREINSTLAKCQNLSADPGSSRSGKKCSSELDGPLKQDWVEGWVPNRVVTGGRLDAKYLGDVLEFDFDKSDSQRFLVINELYHQGWKAYANGRELPVFPTNVVMRGVPVPAGINHIRLQFEGSKMGLFNPQISQMHVFLFFIFGLVLHFIFYFFGKSRFRSLASEGGILKYYFSIIPFIIFAMGFLKFKYPKIVDFPTVMAVLSLAGIYCLSILELWALSEGGYSLRILLSLQSGRESSDVIGEMMCLGDRKRQQRIQTLEKLGLVNIRDRGLEMTDKGRRIASVLRLILVLTAPGGKE